MANNRVVGNLLVQMRADLGQLRMDVKEIERTFNSGFTSIQSSAATAAKLIGGYFSIQALAGFAKSIVDLGGRLTDLSQQTGISASTLSGFKSTLEENGATIESFATAIYNAQKNLGQVKTEADPVAQAIKRLGLNLDELRNVGTEKFMNMLVGALAKIENPIERNALGAIVMTKAFRELSPAIDALAKDWEKLKKSGLTDEQVKRLDEVGDAWTRFKNKLAIGTVNAFDIAIANLQKFGDAMNTVASQQRKLMAGATIGGAKDFLPERKTSFVPLPDLEGQKKAAAELKKILEEAGKANAELWELMQKKGEDAGKSIIEVFSFLDKSGLTPVEEQIRQINSQFDELIAKLSQAGADTGQNFAPQIQRLRDIQSILTQGAKDKASPLGVDEDFFVQFKQSLDSLTVTTTEQAKADLKFLDTLQQIDREAALMGPDFDILTAKIGAYRQMILSLPPNAPGIEALQSQLKQLRDDKSLQDLASKLGQTVSQGITQTIQGIAQGTQTVQQGLKNMLRNVFLNIGQWLLEENVLKPLENALKTALQDIMQSISSSSSSSSGSIFGSMFSTVMSWFSSIFAAGGFEGVVHRPTSFIAGEAGPERVSITPLSKMGGGGQGNVRVEINGDITPRRPDMRPEDVIKIFVDDYRNIGHTRQIIRGDRR